MGAGSSGGSGSGIASGRKCGEAGGEGEAEAGEGCRGHVKGQHLLPEVEEGELFLFHNYLV
jgi:hypothetical protein